MLALSACSPVSNGEPSASPTSATDATFAQLWDQLVDEAGLDQISGYELATQGGTRIISATVLEGTTATTHRLVAGAGLSSAVNQGPTLPLGPTFAAGDVDLAGAEAGLVIDGCDAPAVRVVTTLSGAQGSYRTCGGSTVADSTTVAGQGVSTVFDASVRESWDGLAGYLAAIAPQQLKIGIAQGVLTSVDSPAITLSDGASCSPVLALAMPGATMTPYAASCGQAPSGAGQTFNLADYDLNAIWEMVNKATNNDPAALATVSITSPEAGKISVAMTSSNGTDPLTQELSAR